MKKFILEGYGGLHYMRETPKSRGQIWGGVLPETAKLVNSDSACNNCSPSIPVNALIMSLRCCGQSPPDPPAEPSEKGQITRTTPLSCDIDKWHNRPGMGVETGVWV